MLNPTTTKKGTLIALLIFTVAAGGAFGYWSYKFSKKYAVSVIAAGCGIVAGIFLIKLGKLKFKGATFIGAILGAAGGFYIGHKTRRFVKSVGTSLIGSFLFVRGVGTYAGGYPSETAVVDDAKDGDLQVSNNIIAYFGGFLVMTIGCSVFQLWYFRDDDKDVDENDEFAKEDEGRTCGCF